MATLVRWEPFRELAGLQNEMSRLMNSVFEAAGNGGSEGARTWIPAVDVWETEDEVVYALDLPGVPQDSISVELEDGALTVSATRERSSEISDERFHRSERRVGTFSRTIPVPAGVDEAKVAAAYRDGVLELRVAKPEQPKPKRIEIGGGSSEPKTIEASAN
jgi:HSP20 family protein